MKVVGGRFVKGLADLVGGEKDPRNLMIVFSVMKVILVEFDIVKHVEVWLVLWRWGMGLIRRAAVV